MRTITIKAWAKINLTLDVLGKRPDGYHELASVMQAISLYDTLTISESNKPGIEIKLTETKSIKKRPDLPIGEGNLVYQAAQLLTTKFNIRKGILIELQKNIPIAAGLAGGSSDCAATLLGLNHIFDLNISQRQLLDIGKELGADVPFCIMGNDTGPSGTALAEGIGERLTPLPSHPGVNIVLARLPVMVSTKKIFSYYTGRSEQQTSAMVQALKTNDVKKIAANLANDLVPIVTGLHPEVLTLITAFREQNAMGVSMTGSGPTVFAYYPTEASAFMAIKNISEQFPDCEIFSTNTKQQIDKLN